jgi:hypothetical protein|tara:strand:+ start:1470 stop:2384 length:915 start_codon:yes stop_codon:yes gene_type:complete
MSFSITSNYSGEHAGQYIGAALRSAKSLENLTILENIKFKRNITNVSTASMIADATCDFTDAGTLTLTEKVLNPKELQINVDLCKKDLLADWQAAQMAAGAHNRDMSDDFAAFVVSYLSATIADHVEANIWHGNDANAGGFTGYLHDTVGLLIGSVDGTVVQADKATGAFSASNIVTNLTTITNAIPTAVYSKEDVYIYMSTTAYRFYLESQANAGYQQLYNMNDSFVPMYNGIKIAVCPGMQADRMVAAQKSNLFFGTDLVSDHTEIRMLDMSDLDGSDNIRVVAKFTAGVQVAQGADVVLLD